MAHTFSVWAPDAGSVELWRNGERAAMQPGDGGWWVLDMAGAGPGDRYGFSLDGGDVRPDPRSPSQPDGVHEPSEVVDHGSFEWRDGAWRGFRLPGAVLYELHIGTFTPAGTFDAAIDRIPHLADLGVTAVEIMPVAAFDGNRGWGYDGVALYAPHPAYGGPEGLKRLVDALHRAGIGAVLDVVYNHLGPSGNYLGEFGPYFSDQHRTNWGDGVNLDGPGSDEVRAYFVDNARAWLRDYHFDGLRLDAVHALADDSATHFLEALAGEVAALSAHVGRPLTLIAESDLNDPRFVRPPLAGGFGLDSAWADEWHHAWHAVFSGERNGYYEDFGTLEQLAKALGQAWVYDGVWSPHRGRHHGRPPTGLTGDRFVVCTQNHDQIGNRAAGDRSAALMSAGRLEAAAALLLLSPFVPMLFQGEEWGASTPWQYFTDFADAELGRAVTEGRRSEFSYFGWEPEQVPDPQDPATFERSKLGWAEVDEEPHGRLLEWHRRLIELRRRFGDVTDGRLERVATRYDEGLGALAFQHGTVLVMANLGASPIGLSGLPAGWVATLTSDGVSAQGSRLMLPPDTAAVVDLGAGEERHGRRTATSPPTILASLGWDRI